MSAQNGATTQIESQRRDIYIPRSRYEEAGREGFVMGFLENELWKTGVHYR
jgi:hypothetical protein